MYKLIKPLKESGKMAVTPQQSACLQNALFETGYAWWRTLDKNIKHVKMPVLYWDNYDKGISYGKHLSIDKYPLHKFEDYFEQ